MDDAARGLHLQDFHHPRLRSRGAKAGCRLCTRPSLGATPERGGARAGSWHRAAPPPGGRHRLPLGPAPTRQVQRGTGQPVLQWSNRRCQRTRSLHPRLTSVGPHGAEQHYCAAVARPTTTLLVSSLVLAVVATAVGLGRGDAPAAIRAVSELNAGLFPSDTYRWLSPSWTDGLRTPSAPTSRPVRLSAVKTCAAHC